MIFFRQESGSGFLALWCSILVFLLFAFASCKTGSHTTSSISLEEARAIALKFKGRYKAHPPRGFGADIEALITAYPNPPPESGRLFTPSPSPRYTRKSVAELASVSGGPYGPGPRIRQMAWSEFIGGNANNALELVNYVEGLDIRSACGTVAMAVAYKAIFLADLGAFKQAESALWKSVRILDSCTQASELPSYYILLGKAMIASARGDMEAAESLFYSALEMYNKVISTEAGFKNLFRDGHESFVKANIAGTLVALNRLNEAEIWIREALSSRDELSFYTSRILLPYCLGILSDIYYARNRYEEAMILTRTSLNFLLQNTVLNYTDALARAKTREAHARNLMALERWQEALDQFELISKELLTDPGTFQLRFANNPDWGFALLLAGNPEKALALFDKALAQTLKNFGRDHDRVLEINAYRAMALEAGGSSHDALLLFDQVLPQLTKRWKQQQSGSGDIRINRFKIELIIESYLELLTEIGAQSKIEQALSLPGMVQARAVGQAVSASAARALSSDPELTELIRQRQDTALQLSAVQVRINEVMMAKADLVDSEVKEELMTDAFNLEQSITVLDHQLKKQFPRYASIVNPEAMGVFETRQFLHGDEAFIFIFPGRSNTYVWAFRKTGPVAFAKVPLDRRTLADMVARLRTATDPGDIRNIADIPEFDVTLAHDLYNLILAPVAKGWQSAKSLLTVTPDALGQLPFIFTGDRKQ